MKRLSQKGEEEEMKILYKLKMEETMGEEDYFFEGGRFKNKTYLAIAACKEMREKLTMRFVSKEHV